MFPGKPESGERKGLSERPADLIARISGGTLSSGDSIMVGFAVPVVEQNRVGKVQSPNPFTFSPPMDGTARWLDPATFRKVVLMLLVIMGLRLIF